jgi:dihydroorotase
MNDQKIIVPGLYDMHQHFREKEMAPLFAQLAINGGCEVSLLMPNTNRGLLTRRSVLEYVNPLRNQFPKMNFVPVVQITEFTTKEKIHQCVSSGILDAKVYPLNRTTKSQNGIRDYLKILSIIKLCGEVGIRVHFHPEHPWMLFDNRDAEFAFLPIVDMFLRETKATIIWEHGTDSRCIPFWKEMAESGRFYVTFTPHHLLTSEDDEFGVVESCCKPPIKTRRDCRSLVELVCEGHEWVFAGSDGAPHPKESKHRDDCGPCACGAFHGTWVLSLYAHALRELLTSRAGVTKFVAFTTFNAVRLFDLPPPRLSFGLVNQKFKIPYSLKVGDWEVQSFWGGKEIDFIAVKL